MQIHTRARNQKRIQKRNLIVLRKYVPALEEQLERLLQARTQRKEIQCFSAQSGRVSLRMGENGTAFHLHSTYDPMAEAERWVEHVGQEEWQIGILFGLGLGYHVEALCRRYPERRLVVVEPDPQVLQTLLQTRDVRPILRHPNLELIVQPDARAAARQIFNAIKSYLARGKLDLFAWAPYRRRWPDFWNQLQQQLGELSKQDHVNLATNRSFSLTWPKNVLLNIRASVTDPSVTRLFPLFRGKPAILVSSGPSLEKNVHLLVEAKDRAFIVAAGSAVGALYKHGIEPDAVVSFDAGAPNYFHFARLDSRRLPLIYSAVIQPRLLAEYQGPRFAMGVDVYPHERWIYHRLGLDRGTVASGPSVANLTWDLLRQMGCDPIIFVGQDLAYTNDKTHAAGVAHAKEWTAREQARMKRTPDRYETVEDIWGNQVRTKKSLLAQKIWFEQRIAALGKGRRFIDATEGGAKIAGTEIMTLRQAIDRYCREPFHPYRQILNVHRRAQEAMDAERRQQSLTEYLSALADDLDEIEALCDRGVQALSTLAATDAAPITAAQFDRIAGEVSQIDVALGRPETYNYFLRPSLEHKMVAFATLSKQLQEETDLATRCEKLVGLYGGLFDAVGEVVAELRQHVRTAHALDGAYTPGSLDAELDEMVRICQEAQEPVAELMAASQAGELTPPIYQQLLARLQAHDDRLNAVESYRDYVHRWIRTGHSRVSHNMGYLAILLEQANAESDLNRKGRILAHLYKALFRSVQEAVAVVREMTDRSSLITPTTEPIEQG